MRRRGDPATFLATLLIALLTCRAAWTLESSGAVTLSYDKLVKLGGTVVFKANILDKNGNPPNGDFVYSWQDDAEYQHHFVSETTSNTSSYYKVKYPASKYHIGVYAMEVDVCKWEYLGLHCGEYAKREILFPILCNGNITVSQVNNTNKNGYISSAEEAKLTVNLNKDDYDYIVKKATSITTHWFIDCQYFNRSSGFELNYNFTQANMTHVVEALVIANFDPPTTTTTTTTIAPTTTSVTPSPMPTNGTASVLANITSITTSTTTTTTTTTTTPTPSTTTAATSTATVPLNISETFPFVCRSQLTPKPKESYGYFTKEVNVKAPISKLNIDGSTWIQPWNSLELDITCNGTGPFRKCIEIHFGKYNATGNETCNQDDTEVLDTCKFVFSHYFLDALEYTVLIILSNDVSTEIHPVAVNIYKRVPKPQLSVIIVPVSCSLVAVVIVVFGIAYYVQNKSRFTVEVADFDFGQRSADMEYKTFTERLRDSFNNAGYKQLNNAKDLQ